MVVVTDADAGAVSVSECRRPSVASLTRGDRDGRRDGEFLIVHLLAVGGARPDGKHCHPTRVNGSLRAAEVRPRILGHLQIPLISSRPRGAR
jgi:hypothetical protein